MSRTNPVGPAALLLLAGCLDEAGFPARAADDLCQRYQLCRPIELAELYEGGEQGCEDDIRLSLEFVLTSCEQLECAWDEDRARACLEAIDAPTCDDLDVPHLLDVCSQAWVQPS